MSLFNRFNFAILPSCKKNLALYVTNCICSLVVAQKLQSTTVESASVAQEIEDTAETQTDLSEVTCFTADKPTGNI